MGKTVFILKRGPARVESHSYLPQSILFYDLRPQRQNWGRRSGGGVGGGGKAGVLIEAE